ncbi:PD-(D/E)XK nuclease family protein [Ottowia testudinis]|uniref:PD-(D/E)XK nuclease family protein n=1 Tax=Ottowia testudinis TaxID=2816950 RepID=UPI003D648B8E
MDGGKGARKPGEGGAVIESALAALAALAFAALLAWPLLLWRSRGAKAWMPLELRRATLAHAEKLFRGVGPVVLTAKVDRAYRVDGKTLVLVELKTRRSNRPCRSDVIELSAQRVAIMRQTGEEVALHGYVVVRTDDGNRTAHRVSLLSPAEVDALIDRRAALLEGSIQPRLACAPNLCSQCVFEKKCTSSRVEGNQAYKRWTT